MEQIQTLNTQIEEKISEEQKYKKLIEEFEKSNLKNTI